MPDTTAYRAGKALGFCDKAHTLPCVLYQNNQGGNKMGMNYAKIVSMLFRIMLTLAIMYIPLKLAGRMMRFIAAEIFLAFMQRYLSLFVTDEDDMYIIAQDYFEMFERIKFQ